MEAHAGKKLFWNIKMVETLFKDGIFFCSFEDKLMYLLEYQK